MANIAVIGTGYVGLTLARTVLGWEPAVQLREGLERTVAYFKTVL